MQYRHLLIKYDRNGLQGFDMSILVSSFGKLGDITKLTIVVSSKSHLLRNFFRIQQYRTKTARKRFITD